MLNRDIFDVQHDNRDVAYMAIASPRLGSTKILGRLSVDEAFEARDTKCKQRGPVLTVTLIDVSAAEFSISQIYSQRLTNAPRRGRIQVMNKGIERWTVGGADCMIARHGAEGTERSRMARRREWLACCDQARDVSHNLPQQSGTGELLTSRMP